jgi:phosphatidylserine decarboxylase
MDVKLPIVKEGILTAGVYLFVALFCYTISCFLFGWLSLILNFFSWVSFALLFFVLYFYRDPERTILLNDNFVLSPADGRIFEIHKDSDKQIIKIFMSPLNIHIQRAPVSGTVESINYKKGKFLPAYDEKAEIENEQNIITISTRHGDIEIKQIAGILARRIVCWVNNGDKVIQGQRIGMIRLGSQVDLSFPESFCLKVEIGTKVKAGITVIAER